jgi:N-acetylneuraminate epimerase
LAGTQVLVLSGEDRTTADYQPSEQHPGLRRDVLAYDTKEDTWKVVSEVPSIQVTVPTVLWHGRCVVPSGEIRPGMRTPEEWSFSHW